MNSAVINIKTDPQVKARAQKVADELGFSLSGLINGYLRVLIKTKAVHFDTSEEPSEYLLQAINESQKEKIKGKTITFKNFKDELDFLDDLIESEKN